MRIDWSDAPDLWLLKIGHASAGNEERAAAAVGSSLPTELGTFDEHALFLAPGEWLLEGDHSSKEEQLTAHFAGSSALLAMVGAGATQVDLAGRDAAAILSSGCSLDFGFGAFPPGRCTRTLLAGVSVVLKRTGTERFTVYLELSLSVWLRDWFAEALRDAS